jgi:hypothetical protein
MQYACAALSRLFIDDHGTLFEVSFHDARFPCLVELSVTGAYVEPRDFPSLLSTPRLKAGGLSCGARVYSRLADLELEILQEDFGPHSEDSLLSVLSIVDCGLVPSETSRLLQCRPFPPHLRFYLTEEPYSSGLTDDEEKSGDEEGSEGDGELSDLPHSDYAFRSLKSFAAAYPSSLQTLALPPLLQPTRLTRSPKLKKLVEELLAVCMTNGVEVIWDDKIDLGDSVVSPVLWDYAKKLKRKEEARGRS